MALGQIEPVLGHGPPAHDHRVLAADQRAVWPRREREDRDHVGRGEIEEAEPRWPADVQDDRVGIRFAVDPFGMRRRSLAKSLQKEHVVVGRRSNAGITDDQRALQAAELLAQLVHMRVIHERARTRWCESRLERIPRRDRRRQMLAGATEPRHSVHIAVLDFDAVPVHARRFAEMVHDHDRDRNAPRQVELGTELPPRFDPVPLLFEHEVHRRQWRQTGEAASRA